MKIWSETPTHFARHLCSDTNTHNTQQYISQPYNTTFKQMDIDCIKPFTKYTSHYIALIYLNSNRAYMNKDLTKHKGISNFVHNIVTLFNLNNCVSCITPSSQQESILYLNYCY